MANKEAIILDVRYHVDLAQWPEFRLQFSDNGDWIDLRSSQELILNAGDVVKIPLGVAIKLPENYEAHIEPRSSTLTKRGILCPTGVIDSSYCGDNDIWHLQGYAIRATKIEKGDRIAQFRIFKKMDNENQEIILQTVDHLDGPDRGGFGSSGLH